MAPPRKPLGIRRGTGGVAEETQAKRKRRASKPLAVTPPDQQDRQRQAQAPAEPPQRVTPTGIRRETGGAAPREERDFRKPPVRALQQQKNYHGSSFDFAARLGAFTAAHEQQFGYRPSPGFALDVAASKVPEERFGELLGVPKSKRTAQIPSIATWAREEMTPLTQEELKEGLKKLKDEDDDDGFLDKVGEGLGAIRRAHYKTGELVSEAEKVFVKTLAGAGEYAGEQIRPGEYLAPGGKPRQREVEVGETPAHAPLQLAAGPELTNLAAGEEFDPKWLALEAALFPIRGGGIAKRIVRLGRRAEKVAKASAEEEKVRKALGPARKAAAEQAKLGKAEKGKRFGEAEAAQEIEGGGIAGFEASKAKLRGELPKVQFQKLREGNLSDKDAEQLIRKIQNHPELTFGEKLHAQQGFVNALQGNTPQKSQIRLLSKVYGQEAADEVVAISKSDVLLDVANIPRALMSSFDLSAPFRQALVAGAGHPGIFAKNFVPMLRAARSEKAYKQIMKDIEARPNIELYERGGLSITDRVGVSTREEQFMSNIAEKLPPVRWSSRAYTGFLNKMRVDVFDDMVETARAEGVNVENTKFLKGVAHYVNAATGRGNLGRIDDWAPALNAVFFSPRLIASRINFLNPAWYMHLDPFARKQAMRSMLRLSGAASVVLGIGAYGGAKVGLDPRSADFAKLRINNTRIDVLGGFQQYIRLVSQIASGKIVSSSTGKTLSLGPGFGQLTRKDILERFLVSKTAPPASFIYDFFKGTDFAGEPFEVKNALIRRLVPFIAQDIYELRKETGNIPAAVGATFLAGFGFTVQTYGIEPAEAKAKKKYDEYGELVLGAAREVGMIGKDAKLPPQVDKALNTRSERYQFRAKEGADDLRSRFSADITFLLNKDAIGPKEAVNLLRWAQRETRDYKIENKLDQYFDDLYGDVLTEWDDEVKEVAGFKRDVLQLRLDTLASQGVIPRQELPKDQKALYALGRKYLDFQKEASEKLRSAYDTGDEVARDKLFAEYRAWEEEQDQPVKIGGIDLPSFVRIAWGDSSPREKKEGQVRAATQSWKNISSFDKELLGKKARYARAWLYYEDGLAKYRNEQDIDDTERLDKDQLRGIAKQVNRAFPGFIGDWDFDQKPLARRLSVLKVVTKSPVKKDWLELIGVAEKLIVASSPGPNEEGISKTVANEAWRRWVNQAREVLPTERPKFWAEIRTFEKEEPSFLYDFLE